MSTNFRKFPDGGLGLIPRTTDPSSPTEGDIQFSDGTARDAGLWQYLSGSWTHLASASGTSISARYSTTAGQSISNSSTAIIDFGTLVFETGGTNVTTGASWNFECPVGGDGIYQVNSQIRYASASFAAGGNIDLYLYKNGSEYCRLWIEQLTATATFTPFLSGSDMVDLEAGDTIDIRTSHNEGAARSLATTARALIVSITKVD